MPDFTLLMLVGPAERELGRVHDFLDSLFHFEPETPRVVLIDDSRIDRQLARLFSVPPGCRLVSLANPRKGRGEGWLGGACAGLLAGLRWLHQNGAGDFVVKADTDALVIAPFAEKIADRFQQTQAGMLGSYLHHPDGSVRPLRCWAPIIRKFLLPICRRRSRWFPVETSLLGRPRKIRLAILDALMNGYRLAEHCLGGSYAISARMIQRMAAAGHLDDPLRWLHSDCVEDAMMGMYAYAVGLRMEDFNRENEPFGVVYQGLPDQPEKLLARGYSLIHSLKTFGEFDEEASRRFFRAVRHGAAVAVG